MLKKHLRKFLWEKYPDYFLNKNGYANNTVHADKEFIDLFIRVVHEGRALISFREMHNIYQLVKQVEKIEGDIAEVGVYRGGSAKIICAAKKDKEFHLFDTFEGMPDVDASIDKHKSGDFIGTSLEDVRDYLGDCKNIHFYKGYFPKSADGLKTRSGKYAFVNLDVDIYQSTLDGLKYFYPRLSRGGILLSHDYRSIDCPGVKKAYDEFFSDKPEVVIGLWDTQCLVVKA